MAVAAGEFYILSFQAFGHASWTTAPPRLEPPLGAAVRNGTDLICYCVADGDPFTIAFLGGFATLPAGVINVETIQPKITSTRADTSTMVSMIDMAGTDGWIVYDSTLGMWNVPTGFAALGAFLDP